MVTIDDNCRITVDFNMFWDSELINKYDVIFVRDIFIDVYRCFTK